MRLSYWSQYNTGANHGKRHPNLCRPRDQNEDRQFQTYFERRRSDHQLEEDQQATREVRTSPQACLRAGQFFPGGDVPDHAFAGLVQSFRLSDGRATWPEHHVPVVLPA